MTWEFVAILLFRLSLVALFVPFSIAYMIADFKGATAHAASASMGKSYAAAITVSTIILKIVCAIGIVTGFADRLAALGLASFCLITALLYKRFWAGDGVRFTSDNANLPKLWDFLKNVSLAAAFVMIGFGQTPDEFRNSVAAFVENPLASTAPYSRGSAP